MGVAALSFYHREMKTRLVSIRNSPEEEGPLDPLGDLLPGTCPEQPLAPDSGGLPRALDRAGERALLPCTLWLFIIWLQKACWGFCSPETLLVVANSGAGERGTYERHRSGRAEMVCCPDRSAGRDVVTVQGTGCRPLTLLPPPCVGLTFAT